MDTHIVYRRQLFFKAIAYVSVCLVLGLATTYLLKSKTISIVLLILMVLPVFFIRMLLNLSTKKVFIELQAEFFIVRILNTDGSKSEVKTDLDNILSYSIQFPADNMSDIKFKLKNDEICYYSFFQRKKNSEDVDSEELINSFHSLIMNYNRKTLSGNKIVFLPSFYASFKGLIFISSLSGLLIITVVAVSLFRGLSSVPFTFIFTLLIILQLGLRRKKEIEYFKQIQSRYQ